MRAARHRMPLSLLKMRSPKNSFKMAVCGQLCAADGDSPPLASTANVRCLRIENGLMLPAFDLEQ